MTEAELGTPETTHRMRRGPITTTQLVMYAGASGDFNRIHYDHPFAVQAGLGGLLAHGMLTMAFAASCVAEAFGPASRISRLDARFTSPVRVGDIVDLKATVTARGEAVPITAMLTAEVDGRTVLQGEAEIVPAPQAPFSGRG
jgi:acyl dehydratase